MKILSHKNVLIYSRHVQWYCCSIPTPDSNHQYTYPWFQSSVYLPLSPIISIPTPDSNHQYTLYLPLIPIISIPTPDSNHQYTYPWFQSLVYLPLIPTITFIRKKIIIHEDDEDYTRVVDVSFSKLERRPKDNKKSGKKCQLVVTATLGKRMEWVK